MTTVESLAMILLIVGGGAILSGAWIEIVPLAPHKVSRFSLRVLLLVTTLVAMVLGLGVWLTRS